MFLLASLVIASKLPSGKQQDAESLDARINRIVNGLPPAAYLRGQPIPTLTLADRMKHYHVPGVSIAFIDRGQIIWARGFGLADVAANKPVTPDTLFQAASISKSVTALGALRLVQERKLNLDEDVNHKFVHWKVPENEFTRIEKVTLRRLLSHTAGFNVGGFAGYTAGEPLPTEVEILNGEKPANNEAVRVNTRPGKEFRYSGGGYVAVQLLMMDVTGKSFPKLMRDLIFEPLGMTHSTFEEPLPKNLWSSAASPYNTKGDPVAGGWRVDPEMAPAGLWTTPSDLALLEIEVQKAYTGQSNKIISSALAHQMLDYQSEQIYGLGLALGERSHARRFWSSGANAGYKCQFDAYTEGGQGVAIMTNGDSGLSLIGEIRRAVAQEYGWSDIRPQEHPFTKIDPPELQKYTGVYLFAGQFRFTITRTGDKLFVQYNPFGEEPQELLTESATRLFMTSQPVVIDVQFEQDGSIKNAKLRNGPEQLDGVRISGGSPP
jgi:CubicO group peptidase (beta-lactamase class C family)